MLISSTLYNLNKKKAKRNSNIISLYPKLCIDKCTVFNVNIKKNNEIQFNMVLYTTIHAHTFFYMLRLLALWRFMEGVSS